MTRNVPTRGLPPMRDLIRHQFALILAAVVFAMGLSWTYVITLPATYTATSVILLSPAPGNPLTSESASGSAVQMTVALETEAQLIRTPAVADVVSTAVGREIPDTGERLSVSVPSNTQMLQIAFTSSSPAAAQEGAQAFAEGYLNYREERAVSLQESRIERLDGQIDEADANLRRATDDVGDEEASTYTSQEAQLFADRLAQLNNSLSETQAISTFPGSTITEAELPERANEIPAWMIITAGGTLGLVAGLSLALLREWRRDLVRDSDGVEVMGLPVLASIGSSSESALAPDSNPVAYEGYRQLRTAVIARSPRPHVLAVTEIVSNAVMGGTGRSGDVAANLSVVLAEARFSVLLISTSSQEEEIQKLLRVRPSEGLAEVAHGNGSARHFLLRTQGVALLSSGIDSVGSSDLTASTAFRDVVDELYPQYDYVILAASAAGSADGDAALLAAHSAILVLSPDTVTRSFLGSTLDRLERLGVEVNGAVMMRRGERTRRRRSANGLKGSEAKRRVNLHATS